MLTTLAKQPFIKMTPRKVFGKKEHNITMKIKGIQIMAVKTRNVLNKYDI